MRAREFLKEEPDDLVQTQTQVKTIPQSFDVTKTSRRTMRDLKTGKEGGAYARGEEDPRDPHMFKKQIRQPAILEKDAFYQFVEYIKPYVNSNPFLPRVYNVKIVKDAQGRSKVEYQIEKLFSIEDANRMTDEYLEDIFNQKYLHPLEDDDDYSVFNVVSMAVTSPGYISLIKDTKLKQAIMLIQNFLKQRPEFKKDLHLGNMMVRFSPAPQLVFTDPAHDSGESIIGYNTFKGGWPRGEFPNEPIADMDFIELTDHMNRVVKDIKEIATLKIGYGPTDETRKQSLMFKKMLDDSLNTINHIDVIKQYAEGMNPQPVLVDRIPEIFYDFLKGLADYTGDKYKEQFDILLPEIRKIRL